MTEALRLHIRPIEMRDAQALHALRIMPGVQETISSVYSERLSGAEAFIASFTGDDHHFVAETEHAAGQLTVVGTVGLHVSAKPRKRHMGVLGIMVHTDWQGKGVGRRLLERILDLADNWLMLRRVELVVFASNARAIKLYKSFGFEAEGCLRAASIMNGAYVDELVMGRVLKTS